MTKAMELTGYVTLQLTEEKPLIPQVHSDNQEPLGLPWKNFLFLVAAGLKHLKIKTVMGSYSWLDNKESWTHSEICQACLVKVGVAWERWPEGRNGPLGRFQGSGEASFSSSGCRQMPGRWRWEAHSVVSCSWGPPTWGLQTEIVYRGLLRRPFPIPSDRVSPLIPYIQIQGAPSVCWNEHWLIQWLIISYPKY